MNYNKLLLRTICGILGAALLLVIGVVASDNVGMVEHVFDFHLDEDACREEAQRANDQKKEREARTDEWCKEIRWQNDRGDYANDDRGTVGPPDRDN